LANGQKPDPKRNAELFTVRFPNLFSQRHDLRKAVGTGKPNATRWVAR
jgi:hypothetical protein